jgi:HSP20 family protein
MTLVKFKNRPVEQNFNNLMDDFFAGFPSIYKEDIAKGNFKNPVPVNIKETENSYLLEVVAPGLEKEDFKIQLDKNLLTIEAEKKAENEQSSEKYLRTEYRFNAFKRSFTVDEKIDIENIDAKYVNGILTLNLPKQAEVKASTKNITIQ